MKKPDLSGRVTPELARQSVEYIREIARDHEAAHAFEDLIREAVLQTIAEFQDLGDHVELARIAMSSSLIPFRRYCA